MSAPLLNPEQAAAIVDATMAAAAGDLAPAAAWMKRVGAHILFEDEPHNDQELQWNDAPGVPSGGIIARSDPTSTCVVLLMATLGILWPFAGGAAVMEEVGVRWHAQTKAMRKARTA